jgi:hypothetical protein
MDKLKFIVDGKVHSINPAKQDLFLQKYPQAVPYSSEELSSETSRRIDELVTESNSHDETDLQTENNDRKASEMVNYKVQDGKISQKLASKTVQTALTSTPGSPTSWFWDSGAGKWVVDKVINAVEYFDDEEENSIISNEEQSYLDAQEKYIPEAKKKIAKEKDVKVEELSQDDLANANEVATDLYREDLRNSSWERNVEESVEDLDWTWFMKGSNQNAKADELEEITSGLNKKTENNIIRFKYHTKSLEDIAARLEAIRNQDYTTQEEFNKGKEAYDLLAKEGEKHIGSILNIQSQQEDIGDSNEELTKYLDIVDRNYQWGTNVVGQTAIALSEIGLNLEEAEYRYIRKFTDPARLIQAIDSSLDDGLPDFLKPVVRYAEYKDEMRKNVIGKADGFLDQVRNGLEKPQELSDIQSWEDFGEWASFTTASQLPNTAIMLTTGPYALPILGVTSAGGKFRSMQKEIDLYGAKYSPLQMYTVATVTGLAEALSEKISLGQLSKYKNALGVQDKIQTGFKAWLTRNLTTQKGLGQLVYDPIEEGFTEMVSQFSENIADKYVLGKDVHWSEGLKESFVSGVWMSGVVYKTPGLGINILTGFQHGATKATIGKNAQRIKEINELLSKPLDGKNRSHYEEELTNLVKENNELLARDIKRIDEMLPEEKEALVEEARVRHNLVNQAEDIKNDDSLSKEEKKVELDKLKAKYQDSLSKKNEIVNPYIEKENAEKIDEQMEMLAKEATNMFGDDVSFQVENDTESILKRLKEMNDKLDDDNPNKKSLKELRTEAKQQGFAIQDPATGKQIIFINKDVAAKQGNVNIAAHEFLHAVLFEAVKFSPDTQKALGKSLMGYLNNIDAKQIQNSRFKKRIEQYQKLYKEGKYKEGDAAEEILTLFSDALATGDIKFNENIFTKIGDVIRKILQSTGVAVKFNNGRDVYNFIKDYNTGIAKGKLGKGISTVAAGKVKGKLIKAKTEVSETVKKESRAFEKSNEVQDLYNKSGKDAAFEITEAYRGMVNKIAGKYRDVPGYTTYKDDFIEQLLIDNRGVYGLVMKYNPDSGVPLAAYINKYLASRAIEIADSMFEKEFTSDVSEAKGVVAEETVVEETVEQPSLRKQLNIEEGSDLYNKIKRAVVKTFGTRLPAVTSKEFKKALQKAFRVELKTAMANLIGTRAIKEQFLRDNFEAIYAKLSQEIINKRFRQFAEPVLDKDGKQLREKTPQGNAIFAKRKIAKAEWLSYFIGSKVGASTKGTRKDALAEALAEELAFDATMDVVKDPDVQERRKAIDEILEREQADNYVEETAKQINRDPNTKFALSENDVDFDLTKQEMSEVSKLVREVQKKDLDSLIDEDGNMQDISKYGVKVPKVVRYLYDIGLINDAKAHGFVAGIKKQGRFEYTSALKAKTSSIKDLKAFSKDMLKLASVLGAAVINIPRFIEGLGYINRVLDPAKKKNDGSEGAFYKDFLKATSIKTESTLPEALVMEDVAPMNSGSGIMQEIKDIQKMDIKRDEKIKLFEETILPRLEKANIANLLLAEHIVSTVLDMYSSGKISESSMLHFFQLQTNAVNGLRALTRLDLIRFEDGVQFGMDSKPNVTKNGKYKTEKEARDAYVNSWKQTPGWSLVFKITKNSNPDATLQQIEDAAIKKLSEKGEHLSPNSNTMLKLASVDVKNLTKAETINQVSDILAEHIQWLDINYNLDIVDLAGKTNQSKKGRLKALPKNKKTDIYVVGGTNIDAYSNESQKTNEFRDKVAEKTLEVTKLSIADKAMDNARSMNQPDKGISVFDFDDTLAVTNSQIIVTMPNGKVMKINATEFAKRDAELTEKGASYDFSEFNKVIDGRKGPLFDLATKRQGKFGNKNIFVLTARPAEAANAIHKFLKGIGLNIPLNNITGLADGTAKAKADWILNKAAEGYNNFYFADDAYKNVKAVQEVLDTVDVKSDVQQAKFSIEDLDSEFNNIIEESEGVEAFKEYSQAAAQRIGQSKRSKWKYFLPPSAEDFIGLLYDFLSKGKKGEAQMEFFQKHLIKPFARGMAALNVAKQSISNDWLGLRKAFPQVRKLLGKKTEYKDFTYGQAIRVYLWSKFGMPIPGLSKQDQVELVKIVSSNKEMVAFADTLSRITKLEDGYISPSDSWLAGTIASDLNDISEKIGRKKFLKEFSENVDVVFSKKNLNKIEAIYGSNFREALEDMIYRMKNGTNRSFGKNRIVNRWMNWVNNSVGAIMFLNMRSAILQTLSAVNFVNWSDNNPIKAAIAFANQKQFWSDFAMIFNSDMLKQRRSGLQTDVNEAEIANAASGAKNKASAVLAYILKLGFTPTQIADSFAIAIGGASMYRNRVNTYLKNGLSKKEAEAKAFEDFAQVSEESQQSSRPDLISQQQAGPLGRVILAFQNTPMQYMRLTKKAMRDLVNGRGDFKTNVSKIIYYGAVQNFVFAALQNALFGMMFADEEEEEDLKLDKKKSRIVNSMSDTILRGSGLYGAAVSTIKNVIMKFIEQEKKGWNADHTYTVIEAVNLSPPIGSKLRKLYSAIQTYKFNKKIMFGPKGMGFDIDNPTYDAFGNIVSAVTNLPLDRAIKKVRNVRASLDERNSSWQRIATLLGWTTWDVGIENYDVEKAKDKADGVIRKKTLKKKTIKKKIIK